MYNELQELKGMVYEVMKKVGAVKEEEGKVKEEVKPEKPFNVED